MDDSSLAIRLPVWLALVSYFAAESYRCRGINRHSFVYWWFAAWLLLLFHYLAAFAWHHHWSHAHAVADTAEKTAAVVGVRFGGGVWVNYLLAAAWGGDLWLRRRALAGGPEVPRWWDRTFRLAVAFIVFQATVVFESGGVRLAGIAGFLWLGWCWFASRRP